MSDDAPLARRRTPRRGKSPSRLGVDDNWAFSPAGKWTTTEGKKAKEEAEAVKPPPTPKSPKKAAPTPAPAAVAPVKKAGGYLELREEFPLIANMVEGALLTMLGDGIATVGIKGKDPDYKQMLFFALWGAIVSVIIGPYLGWLNSFSLSKTSKKLDAAAKAVMNCFLSTPFMAVLFTVAFTTYQKNPPLASALTVFTTAIKAEFGKRYAVQASYWFTADIVNLSLVPPKFQLLCGCILGCVWGIINSYITTA